VQLVNHIDKLLNHIERGYWKFQKNIYISLVFNMLFVRYNRRFWTVQTEEYKCCRKTSWNERHKQKVKLGFASTNNKACSYFFHVVDLQLEKCFLWLSFQHPKHFPA